MSLYRGGLTYELGLGGRGVGGVLHGGDDVVEVLLGELLAAARVVDLQTCNSTSG